MTDHDKAIIRVLQKQLDRTDKHRATGREREETIKLIQQIKDNDNTRTIQARPT
jgi:hypothetical protein